MTVMLRPVLLAGQPRLHCFIVIEMTSPSTVDFTGRSPIIQSKASRSNAFATSQAATTW